jgi:hypothetical protein
MVDALGLSMPPEQAAAIRKRVNYTDEIYNFPEINPIDLKLSGYNGRGEVRIANYRWPAKGECKGVVHWIHGYGDYVARYGYIANAFAH